jgi:thiamine-monophosphate kinase
MAGGEFDFLEWLRSQRSSSDLVRLAQGDDLAVLKWPADELLLVGVDQVMDGVHFDSKIHSPRLIGRKAMNRNLSDCAAMACLPAAAVTTAALPRGVGIEYAKELYLGLRDAADPFQCAVVGGDTGSWDGKLVLTVTILGRSAGVEPIARSGAKPGDGIYVTGPLGGSLLGRHMTFEPRISQARQLAMTGRVTAMIDISDGLSRDLFHICKQSGVGAVIEVERVPIHPDAVTSGSDGRSPLDHALNDGEDHELLVTGALDDFGAPLVRIGRITRDLEILLSGNKGTTPLTSRGWEHSI